MAALSYLGAAGLASEQKEDLRAGIEWLVGRAANVGNVPAPFTSDGLAALGIALGGAWLGDEYPSIVARWMEGFAETAARNGSLDLTTRGLFAAACTVLGLEVPKKLPADIALVLREHGVHCDRADDAAIESMLLRVRAGENRPSYVCALELAALKLVYATAPVAVPGQVSVAQIGDLLRRVPHGMLHWTWESKARTRKSEARKWVIEHEYHVQNLLWAILASLFPDLTAEEYTPPVGPKQSRADLGIPSLRLIIEVKYMYASSTMQKMVEQVAADASLYLTEGSRYDQIVAFIWDSRAKTEEHQILMDGLKRIGGVVDAIVIPRPGAMND